MSRVTDDELRALLAAEPGNVFPRDLLRDLAAEVLEAREGSKMPSCQHEFVYRGVVFRAMNMLPGSSACRRFYFDAYFCRRCLMERKRGLDYQDDSHQKLKFGATPAATSKGVE